MLAGIRRADRRPRQPVSDDRAAGSTDSEVVAKKMHELPVNEAYNKDVEVRQDGRVLHDIYLVKVKSPAESKKPYDYYQVLSKIPGKDAFRPLS